MRLSREAKTTSFITENVELHGNLSVQGGIRIDGYLHGRIESNATIYIGNSGRVKAKIIAKSVISSGWVCGNLTAEDLVKINYPGTLEGEITTCEMGIEEGVFFNGECHILSPKKNLRPKAVKLRRPKKAISHRDL